MPLKGRGIIRAYALSLAAWCALSILTGWNYRVFDQQLNIHSTLADMLLLAESRGLAYALLTPPIFYFVRRYMAVRHSFRYLIIYVVGLGPFMVLYACIRWAVLPPWDNALQQYVPRTAIGPFEMIRSGFADQVTMYIAILVAAHAYEYFVRSRRQELNPTNKQTAFVRLQVQQDHQTLPQWLPGAVSRQVWEHSWGLAAGHTWNISNNWVNNFRYGLTRQAFTKAGDSTTNDTEFRFVFQPNGQQHTLSQIVPVHNFTDDVSWIRGEAHDSVLWERSAD